jgi:adenine phosphoribosyltransferase
MLNLLDYVPTVPDFPKPGIAFWDICPLLASADAFRQALDEMIRLSRAWPIDQVAGIESRGLIFASALASRLNLGLVLIRKRGKLPPPTAIATYNLEYGQDALEIQPQVIRPKAAVLLVDDVIATGGTLLASRELVNGAGGHVSGVVALLELKALAGVGRLTSVGLPVATVLSV